MSKIRAKNTKPELAVRRYLHNRGYRYRIHTDLPGRPDIVFKGSRIAIFVHGCFWHQHGCSITYMPKTNKIFWKEKLQANKIRDSKTEEKLRLDGWNVLVVWECEVTYNKESTFSKLETNILKIQNLQN